MKLFILVAVVLALSGCRHLPPVARLASTDLEFSKAMGSETSYFLRRGKMATQLRLASFPRPGLTFSWPAGNSGIFIPFHNPPHTVRFVLEGRLTPISSGVQRGVKAVLKITSPAPLRLKSVIAGSMRDIRDERDHHVARPRSTAELRLEGSDRLVASRLSRDEKTRTDFILKALPGTNISRESDGWSIQGDELRVEVQALTSETPLTPVPMPEFLRPQAIARISTQDLAELSYLIYEESVLAGTDNYLTMFGRDNQILLALGAEALQPKAFEIILGTHFEAMRDDGNLAHEPAVGEFAVFANEAAGNGLRRDPVYDYKMIDTRYMLAPNVARYLKTTEAARAKTFLERRTSRGLKYREALRRNLELILRSAEPFARNPVWRNLIGLERGQTAGNWRDSRDGLGGGRYPFDVNVALVPAALDAVISIGDSLNTPEFEKLAQRARNILPNWRSKTWDLFTVRLTSADANRLARLDTKTLGLKPVVSLREPLVFRALALDSKGKPISVMHSDGGFALLYRDDLNPRQISELVSTMLRPYPLGLKTAAGFFVSNAAFAPEALRKKWSFGGYHMAVIWPWQEMLFIQGLNHQLTRKDLLPATRSELEHALQGAWSVIQSAPERLGSELYTVSVVNGEVRPTDFGQAAGHETSAAIIQTWSKVGILVQPPVNPE